MSSHTDVLHIIKYILYGVIIIPTVFGNGLILYCVYKYRYLRNTMHILIANLAVSDLLVGTVLIPLNLIFGIFDLTQNKYICLGLLAIFVACLGSSCISLMVISCERYLSIKYPLKLVGRQNRRIVALLLLEWSITIISSAIPIIGWNNYSGGEVRQCFDRNIWPQGYIQWINGQFVGLIILNIICYAVVARVAINKARQRSSRANVAQRAQRAKDLQNIITMVIILGMFALCWLPYVVMFIVVQFWDTRQSDYIRRVSLIPGLLNSALNWIVYGYRNMEYRKAFKATLKTLLCRGDKDSLATVS